MENERENLRSKEEGLSIQELVALLWDGKQVVLGALLVSILLVSVYMWMTVPKYQVDALVQIEETAGGPSAVFGDMGGLVEMASPAAAEIVIIKSRMVLGDVVKDLQLDVYAKPKVFPLIGEALQRHGDYHPFVSVSQLELSKALEGMVLVLEANGDGSYVLYKEEQAVEYGNVGDTLRLFIGTDALTLCVDSLEARKGQLFLISKTPFLEKVGGLGGRLEAAEVEEQSGLVQMSLKGADPELEARILNAIADSYVRQNVNRKTAEATQTLEFLRSQIPALKARSEKAETELNDYRLKVGSVDLNAESQMVLTQGVDLESQLSMLQRQRADLLRLYKKDHSTVRTLDKQIAQLERERGNVHGEVKKLPKTQQEILRLTQEAKVSSEVYNNVLNSVQQMEVTRAGQVGNVRVIDYAMPPRKAVEPRLGVTLAIMLLLGFASGAGIVAIRRYWSRGVEDPKELERRLGLPVYAIIPHSESQLHLPKPKKGQAVPRMLCTLAPDDLAVESFRSLRTTLHFSLHDAPNPILLLVGPGPSIGKSFVASNLAEVVAQSGKRVCLVDADMRRGQVHRYFNAERIPGLSDYLTRSASLDEVVRKTADDNLFFVSSGQIPPNPGELLLGESLQDFLDQLATRFDLVIIDSPPLLAVADAVILAKLSGSTLMVLRHGAHRMVEIEQTLDRLQQADVKVKGCIFNDVAVLAGSGSAYSSRYGSVYQYRYTSTGKDA